MKDNCAQHLSDKVVEDFIHGFYGYGNLDSPYWYVGMEEGGGNTLDEIKSRLKAWKEFKAPTTVDVKDYHMEIGIGQFFSEKPVLQTTWSKLIRIHLRLLDKDTSTSEVRSYQRKHWGRKDGNNCLLELMPLPSPGTNKWMYDDFSRLTHLKSRSDYCKFVQPARIVGIQTLIEKHSPKAVLFYGLSPQYMDAWRKIVGRKLEKSEIPGLYWSAAETTIFAVCPHPVAHGYSNAYFESVGDYLAEIDRK
jgi:hypothetical protein